MGKRRKKKNRTGKIKRRSITKEIKKDIKKFLDIEIADVPIGLKPRKKRKIKLSIKGKRWEKVTSSKHDFVIDAWKAFWELVGFQTRTRKTKQGESLDIKNFVTTTEFPTESRLKLAEKLKRLKFADKMKRRMKMKSIG